MALSTRLKFRVLLAGLMISTQAHAQEIALIDDDKTEASVSCTDCGLRKADIFGPTGVKILEATALSQCASPKSLIFKTKTPKGILLLDVMTFLVTQNEKAIDKAKLDALLKNKSHLGAVFNGQTSDLQRSLDIRNRFLEKLRNDAGFFARKIKESEQSAYLAKFQDESTPLLEKPKYLYLANARSEWDPPVLSRAWDTYLQHIRPHVQQGVDFTIACDYTQKPDKIN